MKLIALKLWLIFLISPLIVFAHGGRTNAEGCHTNRKTGEYHCHNGGVFARPLQLKNNYPNESQSCGTKTLCREMSSCDEARYYLDVCGLSRLDGDNDGIPCESICGK